VAERVTEKTKGAAACGKKLGAGRKPKRKKGKMVHHRVEKGAEIGRSQIWAPEKEGEGKSRERKLWSDGSGTQCPPGSKLHGM